MMNSFIKKYAKLALGIFFSVLFIWFAFRSLSLRELEAVLKSTQLAYVFFGIVFLCFAYMLRIKRSQSMLSFFNPDISFGTASIPYMVSIAVNNILPFRMGDVMRVVNFSEWLKVGRVGIIAIVALERLFDFLIVVMFLLFFSFLARGCGDSSFLAYLNLPLFSIIIFLFGVFIVYPRIVSFFVERVMHILEKFSPKLSNILAPHFLNLLKALSLLDKKSHVVFLMLLSLFSWFLEACAFFMAALAVPEITKPLGAWLAMPMGTLATALPSAPGYVGTFHYFVSLAAKALGNSTAASMGFAILIHLMLWLPATVCGAACFLYWMLKRSSRTKKVK